MTKDAAIYLRVSTDQQTVDNQRLDLKRVAEARGLGIVATYAERGSAAKRRPSFDRMMIDVRHGAFNVLLVWSLDRFGRSMAGNVNDALALDGAGVELVSAREPWLDTDRCETCCSRSSPGSPSRSFAGSWSARVPAWSGRARRER